MGLKMSRKTEGKQHFFKADLTKPKITTIGFLHILNTHQHYS